MTESQTAPNWILWMVLLNAFLAGLLLCFRADGQQLTRKGWSETIGRPLSVPTEFGSNRRLSVVYVVQPTCGAAAIGQTLDKTTRELESSEVTRSLWRYRCFSGSKRSRWLAMVSIRRKQLAEAAMKMERAVAAFPGAEAV